MRFVTRRRGLIGLAAAAGTLASASLIRKPWAADPAMTVRTADGEDLEDMSAMKLYDPPVALPSLPFTAADGTRHTIAEFRGHGMVLNLWATWCRPCVAEMPSLARLSRALAPDDIAVMAVSTDHGGIPAVRRFFTEHDITALPILVDTDGRIGEALNVRGIPTTLVIDREGRERGRLEGAADWSSAKAIATVRRLAKA